MASLESFSPQDNDDEDKGEVKLLYGRELKSAYLSKKKHYDISCNLINNTWVADDVATLFLVTYVLFKAIFPKLTGVTAYFDTQAQAVQRNMHPVRMDHYKNYTNELYIGYMHEYV